MLSFRGGSLRMYLSNCFHFVLSFEVCFVSYLRKAVKPEKKSLNNRCMCTCSHLLLPVAKKTTATSPLQIFLKLAGEENTVNKPHQVK